MTAIRSRIHARLATILAAVDIDGLEVERNRHEPVVRSRTLVIHDGPHEPNYGESGLMHFTLRPLLIGLVKMADGADPAPVLDDMYVQVVKALFADIHLGGLAIDTREGAYLPAIDPEGSLDRIGQFTLEIEVDFQTEEGAPDQVAAD
jgi:hypothetical protein